jgi:hypothetical protein
MFHFRSAAWTALIVVGCALRLSIPTWAAEDLVLQKTLCAPIDRVYAAEVQAVGATLKNSVKEACLVNFLIITSGYRQFWTATCRDLGDGKVNVTLAVQGDWFPGVGGSRKKVAQIFWGNFDRYLAGPPTGGDTTPSQAPQGGSETQAAVKISSEPSGADISVDGDYAGSTPSELKLKPGPHSLKITKKDYEPWERSIKVEAGDSRNIAAELEKTNR